MGHTIVEQHPGSAGGNPEPGQGKLHRKTPLAWADPEISIRKGPGQWTHRQLVLQAGGCRQHDGTHRTMLSFKGANQRTKLAGGWQWIHQHQTAGHLHHGEPDRHRHVIHTLKLLQAPDLSRNQLFKLRGTAAVRIQRQQRPPTPALIGRIHTSSSHHAPHQCSDSAEEWIRPGSNHPPRRRTAPPATPVAASSPTAQVPPTPG